MELSTKILNNILDNEQIQALQFIFDTYKKEYLKDLETNPFAHDYTDEEVKQDLKTYLSGNLGYEVQNYDIDNLYNIIKDEFI